MDSSNKPGVLKKDKGSEVVGKDTYRRTYGQKTKLDFSHQGEPTANATLESLSRRLRHECLNANELLSLAAAREKLEASRTLNNQVSPHSELEWPTPSDDAKEYAVYPLKQHASEPDFSKSEST
ncbi:integrase core domain-containing protein [Marinobacter sp.]|uniref:integrase core domain-containing protein n=1 Tax=Marinobacter sp. TaxID=50741 RepID=UPI00387E6CD2